MTTTRLTVRNAQDNGWLDQCSSEFYFRDGFNSTWIRFYPDQTQVRDSGNNTWMQVDCTFDDVLDDPCANLAMLTSLTCSNSIPITEAGSGDGSGSGGNEFDILRGYPEGYDLPDAGQAGFGLERAYGTYEGQVINRPGIENTKETYTNPGTNSFLGRGSYENPSYLSTHTFSNGSAITETIYELGDRGGIFEILYACYHEQGISIDVYYLGALIASTCGRVTGRGKLEFGLDPAIGSGEDRVMIRVRGEDKCRWMYSAIGPKSFLTLQDFEPGNNRHLAQVRTTEYIGTSLFPAPAHSRVTPFENRITDGQYWVEYVHTVGLVDPATGPYVLHLNYETWENADWVEVYHGGERIASTMGNKNTDGLLSIVFDPWRFANAVPDIVVKVMASQRDYGSDVLSQEYMLYDPNTRGYKENRWPCEVPESGINSAGHHSTEDHYLMNDLDNGVASIKVTGYGDFTYTASVFNKKGKLVTAKRSRGTTFLQWFRLEESADYDDLREISVRIDCPIDSSWAYWVGCYIPLLDVEIDDQEVPNCPDVQIAINSITVAEGSTAKFTVGLNYPISEDLSLNYRTEDMTASSEAVASGEVNPYPLFRDSNHVSTVVYSNDTDGYTLMLEADPHRLYDVENYLETVTAYNGTDANRDVDRSVSTFEELNDYQKMIVNMLKHRLGSLSGKKLLVVTHQRIQSYSTPYDPGDSRSDREYEIVYQMSTVMDFFTKSLVNIYGIQVDVHVVNEFDAHGTVKQGSYSYQDATYSSPKNVVGNYDIIVSDQFSEWRHHAKENAGVDTSNHFLNKMFNLEQGTAFGVAVARAAKGSKPMVVISAAAFDISTAGNYYRFANAHAKDLINSFNIKSLVDIPASDSTVSSPSGARSVSVQQIKDKAGDSYLFEDLSGSSSFENQSGVKRMTNFTLANTGSDGSPSTPTSNADYQSKSGSLTIPAGAGSGTISINTFADSERDPNEQFKVIIYDASVGAIIQDEGIATIVESSAPVQGDMNIVYTGTLRSTGTAKVTATKYAHPETILAFKINSNKLDMDWGTDGDLGDGVPQYTQDNGKVACFTMSKTADSATSGVDDKAAGTNWTSRLLAEFEFDPARSYEYKWNVVTVNNSIPGSRVSVKPYCAFDESKETADVPNSVSNYGANNQCMSIQFERAVSNSSLAGIANLTVEIFVKDDLGNVQKSAPIEVSLQQKAQVYSGGGGGGCISFGTMVVLEDGKSINAERLKVGDRLVSEFIPNMIDENVEGWEDWTTKDINGRYPVVSTIRAIKHDWFREYWIINGDVEITQEHLIFVKRDDTWQWMDVRDMKVGDTLLSCYGDKEEVLVGSLTRVDDPIDVVCIDVEESDSYYVGRNPFLVHNVDTVNRKV